MAKIDWDKVEKLLHKGLEDYDIADFQKAVTRAVEEANAGVKQDIPVYSAAMPGIQTVGYLIAGTQRELRSLEKRQPKLAQKLKPERDAMDQLEGRLAMFSEADWAQFREVKTKIAMAIMESVSGGSNARNEKLIEKNLLQLRKTGKYFFKESGRKDWRTV